MSLWRHLTHGVHALTHRTAADRDTADEVQHYFDEATAELIDRGLSADEARRAARASLGSITAAQDEIRAYGWENVVLTSLADASYGVRRLRRAPGFAILSVLTLALGIGASTAIFSAVNPILFQPLPYSQASRIVTIWDYGVDGSRLDVTFGTYREVLERSRSLEAVTVMKPWQPTLTGPAEPERLDGQRVSASYFRVLGVRPVVGREFSASEDLPNGAKVAMLSDSLWQRRFNRDRTIIGHEIALDDDYYTVVGVMPATFENVLSPSADLWSPLQYNPALSLQGREWGHHLRMAARMRAAAGLAQTRHELNTIAGSPVPEFARAPWASVPNGFIVSALQDDITAAAKPALLAVLGAVALVLVIACVNVTNLLLARGAQRRGEFAVRAALGAGRTRMVRQLLTESLIIAALGGLLGMLVAELGVETLVALAPAALPRVAAIRVDGIVFAFSLGITTLVGVAVGLIPALHASRAGLQAGLQCSSARAAGGHHGTRRALVIAEVALALVLLVSAGLLMRSLQRLFAISPGFDASHLLTMQVQTSGRRFDKAATDRFFAQALEAVRGVPGVTAAAFTSQLPLSGDYGEYGVLFESRPDDKPLGGQPGFRYAVSPGYIEAMGIPLRAGRLLDAHDNAGAPFAALVSESLSMKFAGVDLIGRRIHIGPTDKPWYTIVGIVGDVKQTSLSANRLDAVYITPEQWVFSDNPMSLVVRARNDAAHLVPAIRDAIWSVDKDQPIVRVATMDALVAGTAAERSFALILFEAFSFVALALAAIGIYGVLAGSVTERTREIGVRSALGASRASILALVLRQGLSLTAIGAAIGLIGAALASRGLGVLLFDTSRLDPPTYAGVVALLIVVAMMACSVPAWRAACVDPSMALRSE